MGQQRASASIQTATLSAIDTHIATHIYLALHVGFWCHACGCTCVSVSELDIRLLSCPLLEGVLALVLDGSAAALVDSLAGLVDDDELRDALHAKLLYESVLLVRAMRHRQV